MISLEASVSNDLPAIDVLEFGKFIVQFTEASQRIRDNYHQFDTSGLLPDELSRDHYENWKSVIGEVDAVDNRQFMSVLLHGLVRDISSLCGSRQTVMHYYAEFNCILVDTEGSESSDQDLAFSRAHVSQLLDELQNLQLRHFGSARVSFWRESIPTGIDDNVVSHINCHPQPLDPDGKWDHLWAYEFTDSDSCVSTDGSGMRIAVIDSGFDYSKQAYFCNIENMELYPLHGNVFSPFMEPVDDKRPIDEYGHGTMVASLVCSNRALDSGAVQLGFAPMSTLIPIKFTVEKYSNSNNLARALFIAAGIPPSVSADSSANECQFEERYPVALPDIILMTCTLNEGETGGTCLKRIINWLDDNCVLLLASAGNEGRKDSLPFPGAFDQVLPIGSVMANSTGLHQHWQCTYEPATSCNKHGKILIYVPGENVPAQDLKDKHSNCGNWFSICSGTSFAAPIAAGLIASTLLNPHDLRKTDLLKIPSKVKLSDGAGGEYKALVLSTLHLYEFFNPRQDHP